MNLPAILFGALAFACAAILTGLTRRFALAHRVLDVPNARSSHSAPMPRGGGVATVIANTTVLGLLTLTDVISVDVFAAIGVGGAVIALVGWVDDRNRLSAGVRLLVHSAAAIWALLWLGGLPPLQFGDQIYSLGSFGYVLGVLGIVWTLNLFNFMDGIDGIAASEAVFISVAGALAECWLGTAGPIPVVAITFAAACLGFLVWNWPPAKIFMGDVGSGYMGFVVAVMAIMAAREYSVALLVWLIFGAVFFIDATVTLVRRVLRGQRAHEPHRTHAYQWLARRWGSHKPVTVAVLAMNCIWLLPCGLAAALHPYAAGWIALAVLGVMIVIALAVGAGKAEQP